LAALIADALPAGGACCPVSGLADAATRPAPRAPIPAAELADPSAYLSRDRDGIARLDLLVENLDCGACIPEIENALRSMPGVRSARVNLTSRRLTLAFDEARIEAAAPMLTLGRLGYRVVPFDPELLRTAVDREDRRLLRALAVAGFAAGNVMLLSVSVWAGDASDMGAATRGFFHWVSALIAMPTVAYSGQPFFASALSALRGRRLNMDVPISLGVLLATAMSLFETATGGAHAYFDASVTLLFFLLVGRYLDRRARASARSAAEQLMILGAVAATVIGPDGARRSLPVGQVTPGMRVAVAPGDRVPVDGRVLSGNASLDASLVTGESAPQAVAPGSAVFAGSLNLDSPLEVEVAAAGGATLLAEIVRLVDQAGQNRARYVRLADRVARAYSPIVHVLAAATFAGWILAGAGWQDSILTAVAVLIVTCPCALALAVPVVQVVATGRLLRAGVLVKAGDALERLADVDCVVFDKTGTLTLGRPRLVNRADIADDDFALAAGIAAASRHPLARALAEAGGVAPLDGVREQPGLGLERSGVRLGNRDWCGVADRAPGEGSEVWLARPGRAPTRFVFGDAPRTDAAATVAALRDRGLDGELLSGDRAEVAADCAARVGLSRWRGEARPDEKAARLADLIARGRKPLMVGDGMNDAPALAAAYASISPASASDLSRTASDLVFLGEALTPIVEAVDVARAARRLVLQNFAIAFLYNGAAVPLAMAGFVTPLVAAAVMSASSIAVTLNALRLRRAKGRLSA